MMIPFVSLRGAFQRLMIACMLASLCAGCVTEEDILTPSGGAELLLSFKAGNKIVVSPDGKYVAALHEWFTGQPEGGDASLYDLETGKLVRTFATGAFDKNMFALAFSPDGTLLATGGGRLLDRSGREYKPVVVWDVATGGQVDLLRTYNEDIHAVTFTPDGGRVVFPSGGALRFWPYGAFGGIDSIPFDYYEVPLTMRYSPDGGHLLFSPLELVEMSTGRQFDMTSSYFNGSDKAMAFSADGSRIFGCGKKSVVSLDANTLEGLGRIDERNADVDDGVISDLDYNAIAIDPAGRYFATGDNRGDLKIWRVGNGELVATQDLGFPVTSVAFTPDGARVVAAQGDDNVSIVRVKE